MVKYQGSKKRYVGAIQRTLMSLGNDYWHLPFWECCCGSGEVSHYVGKFTNMVDMGPWGHFWRAVHLHSSDLIAVANRIGPDEYEDWVRTAAEIPIPKDPAEFAVTFLALQREAFNGKPIQMGGGVWRTPGFGRKFSHSQWMGGVRRARNLRIASVHTDNLNHFRIDQPANIYLDPDYEGTTGYGRGVDVDSFGRRHSHCNLIVSHHTKLPGKWKEVIDISQPGRKNFAKDTSEYLHVRRRNETSSAI